MTTIISANNTATTTNLTLSTTYVVTGTLSSLIAVKFSTAISGIELINNGSIIGSGGVNYGVQAFQGETIVNRGLIEGSTGIAFNPGNVAPEGGTQYVYNEGIIRGTSFSTGAIDQQAADNSAQEFIFNTGTIIGYYGIHLGSLDNTISNDGTITTRSSTAILTGVGEDHFQNSGSINGDVKLGGGNNEIVNSGDIFGSVITGDDDDEFHNSGHITGNVYLTEAGVAGEDTVYNTGTVDGTVALGVGGSAVNDGTIGVLSLGGASLVANNGYILVGIFGAAGGNQIINTGTIGYELTTAIGLGDAADYVVNSGTLAGISELGGGDDYFNGVGALTNGTVNGGVGNDTLLGGHGSDLFYGEADNDVLNGHGGDDSLNGGLGNDTLKGGGGEDAFIFNTVLNAVTNVDTIKAFRPDDDIIDLSKTIFAKLKGMDLLHDNQFYASTSGHAHDKDDRIIYETDTGKLFYDSNGYKAGDGVLFAIIGKGLDLHAANFEIV